MSLLREYRKLLVRLYAGLETMQPDERENLEAEMRGMFDRMRSAERKKALDATLDEYRNKREAKEP